MTAKHTFLGMIPLVALGSSVSAEDFIRKPHLVDLAAHSAVRAELGLTPEQTGRLDKVLERLKRGGITGRDARSELGAALQSRQLQRLEEIHLQALGGLALEDPEVARKLGLTVSQERRLDDAMKANSEAEREMEDVMKRARFPTAKARRDFIEKYRKAAARRLHDVLTDKQKEQFEALKGDAFPRLEELR